MEDYKKKYEQSLEKVKAYDNALNWMRSVYPTMTGALKEDAEHYFPELKESEDERIKKFLIKCVQQPMGINFLDGIKKDDAIAWLEKQGGQKLLVTPKFRKGDFIRYKTNPDDVERVDCVMDDYYILDIKDKCIHVLFTCQDLWELVEQKTTWSEEDENGLGDALWAIEQARAIAKDENEMGGLWYAEKWLKSLKERMKGE